MRLYSTRHSSPEVSFKQAVFEGLPPDNGLYLPSQIPTLPRSFFERLNELTFSEIGFEVTHALIGNEIESKDLQRITDQAFNFPVPLHQLEDDVNILELFHGPTLAFKDFGARFMSRVMRYFLRGEDKETTILVATSGDTGGAVANGFLGAEGINVIILYPGGKVSEIQELQLTTLGQNISALRIDGTFDDCQELVKNAFLDESLKPHLNLSSANSINICRMIPQSFYYFYAAGRFDDSPLVFSVPSGNLGNLSGGILAQKMGLKVEKFIAASNVNATFPNYLSSGKYKPKPSVETISNAMDVGNPSNFLRINDWYDFDNIGDLMCGYSFDDLQTKSAISEIHKTKDYVMCPHTAVGYLGLKKYLEGRGNKGIVLSTAHPAKFANTIEGIIQEKIEIPYDLQKLLDKDKSFVRLPNNYSLFKEYLLS